MQRFILGVIALALSGCATKKQIPYKEEPYSAAPKTEQKVRYDDYKVDRSYSARSQNERIQFLVLHYTAIDDRKSLHVLTQDEVSAHYLIPSRPAMQLGKPVVLQLVPEEKRAWHAGVSQWNGRQNLNDTSIGIEIVNRGFTGTVEKRWYPYHPTQIDLATRLAKDIVQRYNIRPENVVGHSDIAPLRKYDPGPYFPWKMLAEQGIGAWPDDVTVQKYLAGRYAKEWVPVINLQRALAKYGYTISATGMEDEDTRRVIAAFQMHFRPDNISGRPDAETEAIALALVEKYKN